ncbi:peptidase M14 carboxypeptidase A [Actinobacteria bacterium OK074]|nr:peptidase M14 carboxypeptidase A [Actinobacteria bacterium OK074]
MATSVAQPPLSPWTSRATDVPRTDAYPTVDQLLASFRELTVTHPTLVRERRIGTSRLGEPIPCFTVAEPGLGLGEPGPDDPASAEPGPRAPEFLIVGGVHPNEPVGYVTALHLATALCQDPALRGHFGARWHVVPCIDPDGARLNEGWFATPFDHRRYGRHFYRPAFTEQVEWTFPFAYKDAYFDRALPETLALMRLIDDTRPRFLTTLHNGELGGVYYYVSRPLPALHDTLHAIPAALGIPLETGEPEAPFVPRHAEAVYGCIDMRDAYDHLESVGVDPTAGAIAGTSSADYAARHGTLYLATEVPQWTHPDADDTTPTGERYADAVRRRAGLLRETGTVLAGTLAAVAPHLTLDTPFLRAVRAFVDSLPDAADGETARAATEDGDRVATVAERFGFEAGVHVVRVRYGGMLLRALAAETGAGSATAEVHRNARELLAVYEGWQEQAAAWVGEPLPIAALAGIQYAAILATAATTLDPTTPAG